MSCSGGVRPTYPGPFSYEPASPGRAAHAPFVEADRTRRERGPERFGLRLRGVDVCTSAVVALAPTSRAGPLELAVETLAPHEKGRHTRGSSRESYRRMIHASL
jgi:hypothetical protein